MINLLIFMIFLYRVAGVVGPSIRTALLLEYHIK